MDIEEFNKIQEYLKNEGYDPDEFIKQALDHELERKNMNDVLNTVLDEFKISANKRITNKCLDEKICTVKVINNASTISFEQSKWNRVSIENYESENKRIIIILESPHQKEFELNKPLHPAMGKTGENIRNKLGDVLNEIGTKHSIAWTADSSYDVFLVNAIQSQCSLGVSTEYFRDLMFIGLWFEDDKKQCFETRIKNLKLGVHDIVINACTISGHSGFKHLYGIARFDQDFWNSFFDHKNIKFTSTSPKGMKELVHKAILNIYPSSLPFVYQKMNHPSSWNGAKTYKPRFYS